MNEIEDQLDAAESQLQGHISELGSSEKAAEESMQARKQMENRGINDSKRVGLSFVQQKILSTKKFCPSKI